MRTGGVCTSSGGTGRHPRSVELFLAHATWAENASTDVCMDSSCGRPFYLSTRKHHCRWCGGIFCDSCAPRTRARRGALHRCCARCRIPIIFRAFPLDRGGGLQARPMECILSYLCPRDITALMLTCRTLLAEFPVPGFPYLPSIRARFPSYHEGAQVGKGCFGVVYKCTDRQSSDGRYVAIKRLTKRKNTAYSMWRRVLAETSVLQRVKHPNVARVLDVFQTPEDVVIVMEAGQGGTVRRACRYIREHGLPMEPFVATVLEQISSGLDYLYRQAGIIHRDVKPDNIVVSEDFAHAMLIDFGLAEHITNKTGQTYVSAGTPMFAPPDNLHAVVVARESTFTASGIVMHKGDLFSLGVTAYVMLSGRYPFRSSSFDGQYRELQAGIKCRGKEWASVSPAAVALVEQLLSLRPQDRPDGAGIAASAFVKQARPGMACIADHRRDARRVDDEEARLEWVVLDTPADPVAGGGGGEGLEQFPTQRRTFMSNLYDAVTSLHW